MKKFVSYIAGVVTGMMVVSVPIFADSYAKTIEALVNSTVVKINGATVESDNFVVDGKTYVWIRDVANMLGKKIIWDEATSSANIVDADAYIPAEDDKDVVASVNETTITKGEVNTASLLNPTGETKEIAIQNALNNEIDTAVVLNEAAKNGFTLDDEVNSSAKTLLDQYKSYYKDQFSKMLSTYNLTEESFGNYLKKDIVIENYRKHLFDTKSFTETELKEKYNEITDRFTTITAKHILVKTENRTEAEALALVDKIAKELKSPSQFDSIMSKYSEDTGSKDNIEGMTFKKGEMVTEFWDASLTQAVGVIGKPVKSQFGYHIILVTDRTTDKFEDVKTTCQQELFVAWFKKQVEQWKAASIISINDDVLNSLINK